MSENEKNTNKYAVQVKNLTVQFGDFFAVNHISFDVCHGKIFGFLGANGAGKTTTIRVLCGLITPTAGDVWVAGYDASQQQNIKSKVGYMSQKFTLYNDLTVEENLNFIASLRNLDPKTYQEQRKKLLEFIKFDRSMQTIVQDLPGGTKQQVSLVGALLHNPDIIFLDEPTSGVSPAARTRFWELIRQLAQTGKTVFVTTHYMDEAEQCEEIALMREGKIVALDTPENLKKKTFPMPMFEFNPIHPLNFEEILALKQEPMFNFLEPYGIRFHAAIKDLTHWEENKHLFEKRFQIRSIQPSLEDVFIKTVEVIK